MLVEDEVVVETLSVIVVVVELELDVVTISIAESEFEAQEIEESQPYMIEDRATYHLTGNVTYIKK